MQFFLILTLGCRAVVTFDTEATNTCTLAKEITNFGYPSQPVERAPRGMVFISVKGINYEFRCLSEFHFF